MKELVAGGNASVPSSTLRIKIISGKAADVSAYRLYDNGKVSGDADMVFYGQKTNDDGSVSLVEEGLTSVFEVNLQKVKAAVQKISFALTCDKNDTIQVLNKLAVQVESNNEVMIASNVEMAGRSEAALILGELYRRNNEWKFRFIAQGFNGGLKPLAEHFGVEVNDDEPAAAPAPTPVPPTPAAPSSQPSVNLSKISLTKESPRVNLNKKDDFGLIRVNLNWNQKVESKGFLNNLLGSNKAIDLDLGVFVRLKNGEQGVIQALGNTFGSFNSPPYIELQGDDRTGAVTDGEWLHINGSQWKNIDEVLVFAFIYKGVPNWAQTDGVVTIHMPGQGPIETRLTEGQNRNGMCAIARLVNNNGAISIERINQYFSGHKDMDNAFRWGFRWSAGSK
ncbi:TerD family protein [Budvicia aquatica]|uniref:TerD family protein n=1 Tax=Budvicia aquatica TaxID=82979 RepID=UPI001B68315A|nr:TerD family protein [Budvicia aquatica]MBP9643224.1 TerD family protein [Budvicia sp.]GKX50287.1 tellurite resistance protein [Budvicia aquatica]